MSSKQSETKIHYIMLTAFMSNRGCASCIIMDMPCLLLFSKLLAFFIWNHSQNKVFPIHSTKKTFKIFNDLQIYWKHSKFEHRQMRMRTSLHPCTVTEGHCKKDKCTTYSQCCQFCHFYDDCSLELALSRLSVVYQLYCVVPCWYCGQRQLPLCQLHYINTIQLHCK